MRRRRRFLRDDVLAPWITLVVIIGLWWLGASYFGPSSSTTIAAPELEGVAAIKTPDAAPARARDVSRPAPAALVDEDSSAAKHDAILTRGDDEIDMLLRRRLLIPVEGVAASSIVSNYDQARGGARRHEALDILAPRNTPVIAADDGRIAKLFKSAAGGITIYQFDPGEHYSYYYAHLESYAPGLKEGAIVTRGQTIGFVGTSGNAPPGTPHLHFAIYKLGPDKRWWEGAPLDPALVLK